MIRQNGFCVRENKFYGSDIDGGKTFRPRHGEKATEELKLCKKLCDQFCRADQSRVKLMDELVGRRLKV